MTLKIESSENAEWMKKMRLRRSLKRSLMTHNPTCFYCGRPLGSGRGEACLVIDFLSCPKHERICHDFAKAYAERTADQEAEAVC